MACAAVHPSFGAVCGLAAAALRASERALRVLITALLWLLAAGGLLTTLTAAGAGSAAVPVVFYVVRAMASLTPSRWRGGRRGGLLGGGRRGHRRLAVSLARAACGWTTRAVGAAPGAAPVVATTAAAVTRTASRLVRAAGLFARCAARGVSLAAPVATATAASSGSTTLTIAASMVSCVAAAAVTWLPVAASHASRILLAAVVAAVLTAVRAAWTEAWQSPPSSPSNPAPLPIPATPYSWHPCTAAAAVPHHCWSSFPSRGLTGRPAPPPPPHPIWSSRGSPCGWPCKDCGARGTLLRKGKRRRRARRSPRSAAGGPPPWLRALCTRPPAAAAGGYRGRPCCRSCVLRLKTSRSRVCLRSVCFSLPGGLLEWVVSPRTLLAYSVARVPVARRGDVAAQVEASRPYREAVNEGRGGAQPLAVHGGWSCATHWTGWC